MVLNLSLKWEEQMLNRVEYPGTGDTLYTGTAGNGLRVRVLPKKGFSGFYAVFATDYGGTYRRPQA